MFGFFRYYHRSGEKKDAWLGTVPPSTSLWNSLRFLRLVGGSMSQALPKMETKWRRQQRIEQQVLDSGSRRIFREFGMTFSVSFVYRTGLSALREAITERPAF
ncbi:hypothetical protein FRB91_011723 [Serendipita sp. 411]|nr:hypothetical protein FRB91_011723 [Serendipita sp. 411]